MIKAIIPDSPPIRCIHCNGNVIPKTTQSLICDNCGAKYPILNGIPFIGGYTQEDILGLLEISAVSDNLDNLRNPDFALWDRACAEYHRTGDEKVMKSTLGDDAVWFPWRYNEWLLMRGLLFKHNLKDKQVLDVGAGAGSDAWRLIQFGANVTTIEYNPALAAVGQKNLPEANWIGGFAHILPFFDNQFDMVFCNAALHHMRDVSGAIREFLRVVKPGGYVITSCDSISPDSYSDNILLRMFDSHPDTLNGANENAPRMEEFFAPISESGDAIEVQVITSILYQQKDSFDTEIDYFASWNLKEATRLLNKNGGAFCFSIKKKSDVPFKAPIQQDILIDPDVFFHLSQKKNAAVSFLSEFVANTYVNMPVPHPFHDKFLQLSGWRFPDHNPEWQEGYGRIHAFFRKKSTDKTLVIEFSIPETGFGNDILFTTSLNGEEILQCSISRGIWYSIQISLDNIASDKNFLITISLGNSERFEDRLIRIRRWYYESSGINEPLKIIEPDERPGIVGLMKTGLMNKQSLKILILPGQKSLFRCLGVIRTQGIESFQLIVPDNMRWLLEAEEGIENIISYDLDEKELKKCISSHPDIDLILIPSENIPMKDVLHNCVQKGIYCFHCPSDRLFPFIIISSENLPNIGPLLKKYSVKDLIRIIPRGLYMYLKMK